MGSGNRQHIGKSELSSLGLLNIGNRVKQLSLNIIHGIYLESEVAKVVRCWALDQRVMSSNPGRVTVFAFLGKMLNLDCLSPPRCINGYLFGHV